MYTSYLHTVLLIQVLRGKNLSPLEVPLRAEYTVYVFEVRYVNVNDSPLLVRLSTDLHK